MSGFYHFCLTHPMALSRGRGNFDNCLSTRSRYLVGPCHMVPISNGSSGTDFPCTEQEIVMLNHYKRISTVMLEFFRNGQLCDVEIKAGNKSIKCHRILLACVSRYFRTMFLSGMAESKQSVIKINDIDEDAMETLIHFAYTAEIKLTLNNVQPIFHASSVLQIENVEEAACNFMRANLHPTNCIGIRELAEQHNRDALMVEAENFICEHFLEVTKTREFNTISHDLLKKVIGSDHLNVSSEVEVYEGMINWVRKDMKQRKDCLAALMQKVKLPLVPISYLMENVAKDDLVKKDFDCRDVLDEAIDYQICQAGLVSEIKITERMRPRKSYAGVMFCVGGIGDSDYSVRSMECYDPYKDKWFINAEMTSKRAFAGVCACKGMIYAVGGHDGVDYVNSGERFDPKANNWTLIHPMRTKRRGLALVTIGGAIYAVGGLNSTGSLTTVERYDESSDVWCFLSSMSVGRGGVSVCALKGHLYAVGGHDGSITQDTCERYDPRRNKWTQIAPMNTRRAGAGVASLNGFLYVVGGFDENYAVLNSCEKYDPEKNEWNFVSNMSYCRGGVAVSTLGGLLYATGGFNGMCLNSVESYDPLTDRWSFVNMTNLNRAGAGMTFLDIKPKQLWNLNYDGESGTSVTLWSGQSNM